MPDDAKKILNQVAAELGVTRYMSHRDFLRDVYDRTKAQMKSYSYLQFAADLGLSRTNVLRLVIIGQRPLTAKAAEPICKALGLKGPERKYFLTLVRYAYARLPAERDQHFQNLLAYKTRSAPRELSAQQAEYFAEWYHPAIRELVGLEDFQGDPEWIRNRLNFPLRLEQIKRSLELLAELGVIRFDQSQNRYLRSAERVATEDEIDSLAVVRYHQKMIELGRESITRIDEDERDIHAVTVSLPRSALPALKAKIQQWVHEVVDLEEASEAADAVYQLNLQLFPITQTQAPDTKLPGGNRKTSKQNHTK